MKFALIFYIFIPIQKKKSAQEMSTKFLLELAVAQEMDV